jgi:multidrug efflux pump subunit AcrA (membrane-fusion protein)
VKQRNPEERRAAATNPAPTAIALLGLLVLSGCGGDAPAAESPPAKRAETVQEADLSVLRLDEAAERRLGIRTQPAAMESLTRRRLFGGDVTVALAWPDESGDHAGRKDGIGPLLPPLTALDLERLADQQLAADAAAESARIARDAARRTLARERELLLVKAGSARAVDDSTAQLAQAEAALRSSRARRRMLGAPVFESIAAGRCWVRVSVYAGDVERIDLDGEATLSSLGAQDAGAALPLRRVALPISSAPATGTTDLFYEPLAPLTSLRPGERVAVHLPLRDAAETLVVGQGAVVRDFHGGAWVYERTAPHRFVRRRVVVSGTRGDRVALASGPAPGAAIVTAGAAELFGAELGFAK